MTSTEPPPAVAARRVVRAALVGGLCGLAWAASLRAVMAEVAGGAGGAGLSGFSEVAWLGTFGAILLPGTVVGVLLAVAWARAAAGRTDRIGWFGLAPLVFAVSLGPGQVAFALLAIAGGYAIGASRTTWRRVVCAVIGAAFVIAFVVSIPLAGGPRLALTEPRGAWVAVLGASLAVVLLLAASIPFRGRGGRVG